jgi:hypothetical protein
MRAVGRTRLLLPSGITRTYRTSLYDEITDGIIA